MFQSIDDLLVSNVLQRDAVIFLAMNFHRVWRVILQRGGVFEKGVSMQTTAEIPERASANVDQHHREEARKLK